MDYSIRLAQRAEVNQLAAIELAAAQQYQPYLKQLELVPDMLVDIAPVPFMLRAQGDQRLWVAEASPNSASANLVGFILTRTLAQSFFIVEIDVLPEYGRRGIGSALIQAACEAGAARGFMAVTLTTFRYVPWTIPFYRRLGFTILPPDQWDEDLQHIVQHEERYGFKRAHRAVMMRRL